jgi:stress response protein YsnF
MATNDNRERNRLVELGGSDYKVADNNPNIKNWDVKDGTGRTFGKVDELIFNPASRKVRYLVLDLKGNEFSLKSRHVMVPIGKATLHEKDDDVILSGVRAEQLDGLPTYEKGKDISPSTERHIRNHFSGTTAAGATTDEHHDDSFYEHDDFDENKFYGNRRSGGSSSDSIPIIEENVEIGKRKEETGGARVHKSIEEHEVKENIHLREEHVDVNREKVDRKATDKDLETFKEGETEFRETKEVPVVNKEARVVEEVNINKEISEDEKTIRETERKTKVDTENIDSNDRRDRDNRNDAGDKNRNLSDIEDHDRDDRDRRDNRDNLDKRGL